MSANRKHLGVLSDGDSSGMEESSNQKQWRVRSNRNIFAIALVLVFLFIYFDAYFSHHTFSSNGPGDYAAEEASIESESAVEALSRKEERLLPQGCLDKISQEDYGPHRVPPPAGDVTLVCCESTKGALNIAVHPTWAPKGAENFLTMVRTGYFESRVPLMRALKGFLIQFGLSSLQETQKDYETKYLRGKGGLRDDPQWLPEGPPGRENEQGIKRFQKGYLAYAGAGKNSRGTQLIIALEDNAYLGGGSPWEVPWGHLFGETSFKTLGSYYTGYVSTSSLLTLTTQSFTIAYISLLTL